MLHELYKLFGDKLPERSVFFATEGAPTRAPFHKEFGSWAEFCNDYARYAAKQRAEKSKAATKATIKPKVSAAKTIGSKVEK